MFGKKKPTQSSATATPVQAPVKKAPEVVEEMEDMNDIEESEEETEVPETTKSESESEQEIPEEPEEELTMVQVKEVLTKLAQDINDVVRKINYLTDFIISVRNHVEL